MAANSPRGLVKYEWPGRVTEVNEYIYEAKGSDGPGAWDMTCLACSPKRLAISLPEATGVMGSWLLEATRIVFARVLCIDLV